MEQQSLFQRLRPHLLFIFGLFLLTSLYFFPAWQGKELQLQDVRQGNAATIELRKYKQETGQFPNWTNALFSGMPGYLIAHDYPNTYVGLAAAAVLRLFPRPIDVVFMQMLGLYVLLVLLLSPPRRSDESDVPRLSGTARGWMAAMGAAAYGLASWNLITVEAGHISKILALGYAPGMLAGLMLCLRGQYWSGAALTALFTCLNISANHVQITYYLFLCIGLYVLIEGIRLVRAGQVRRLVIGLAIFGLTTGIGMASYSKRLLLLNQYSKETIRGKSELTAKTTATTAPGQAATAAKPADGLDEEYAFQYSYGVGEALTMLVPNLYGGLAGAGELDNKSETYKVLSDRGLAADEIIGQIPTYWGETNGPAYAGAILVFLFVLGLLISRSTLRWFMLGGLLLTLLLAMGKNMLWFNGLLFAYLPYFNKFRAVTMTLTMTPIFLGGGAALALYTLLTEKPTFKAIQRPFLIAFGLTGGLALLLALLGGSLLDFRGPNDAAMFGAEGGDILRALQNDRASLLRVDAFRAFFYITLAAGLIWFYLTGKLKAGLLLPLLFVLNTVDVYSLGRRFINDKSFIPRSTVDSAFEETPADAQILQDKSLSYRVFDNSGNFMNDNRASYFHKSIGGYSAAKLQRYQELISYAFQNNSDNILNMLNAKYIIAPQLDSTGRPVGQPIAQQNPNALGNAWFVQTVKTVANADEEIAALKTLDARTTAVVDQRYADQVKGISTLSPAGTIQLTAYNPDKMTYQSDSPTEQVAVFSEIFYRGNDDWKAYIDGKETPHFRADYVLRGLRVPAGKHTIEFRFDPPIVTLGNTLDLVMNLILIALVAAAAWFSLRQKQSVTA
ncbi:hypothetical protein FAES_3542 [Fibrella aestuarina BUZ 2]|uniref:YfhO family protein n=1 Tax=Fibrella aestuarina BUZ 2 TaxID=1166018 RepID=I0KBP6_9BACT|nr:YfhO family protein [Fibrella aestuarina]CCH01549.1 hypothetical protein FAES_3542 [Fibrella aestuarina BUZ 2]